MFALKLHGNPTHTKFLIIILVDIFSSRGIDNIENVMWPQVKCLRVAPKQRPQKYILIINIKWLYKTCSFKSWNYIFFRKSCWFLFNILYWSHCSAYTAFLVGKRDREHIHCGRLLDNGTSLNNHFNIYQVFMKGITDYPDFRFYSFLNKGVILS